MNRLLTIFKQQPNSQQPLIPTKSHYSLPYWGGAGGEAFPLFPPTNHITPLPTGEGPGVGL